MSSNDPRRLFPSLFLSGLSRRRDINTGPKSTPPSSAPGCFSRPFFHLAILFSLSRTCAFDEDGRRLDDRLCSAPKGKCRAGTPPDQLPFPCLGLSPLRHLVPDVPESVSALLSPNGNSFCCKVGFPPSSGAWLLSEYSFLNLSSSLPRTSSTGRLSAAQG